MDFSPQTLVLGPGGMKGFLELGCLKYIEEQGGLNNVDSLVGCSVGSIISLLLVCGYSVEEIIEKSDKVSNLFSMDTLSFDKIFNGCIFSMEPLKEELSVLVSDRLDKVPTMLELYTDRKIMLTFVAYNATDDECAYINHLTYPNISCVKAALLSSAIPIVFGEQKYNEKKYLDGALCDPYPIDYSHNHGEVLGLYIKNMFDTPYDFLNNLLSVVNKPTEFLLNEKIKIEKLIRNKCKNIKLSFPGSIGFPIDCVSDSKEAMIVKGYKSGLLFYESLKSAKKLVLKNT